jgi:apolipoprotein N-acyltransferase
VALAALAAGVLLTAGLPPFGWWPLTLIGAGILAAVLRGRGAAGRLGLGAAAGVGFLGPGLLWMTEFHLVGFALAVVLQVALFALAPAATPGRRGAALGLPAALVLVEAFRGVWPFGGVPVATLAQTQVGGPLAFASRLGGGLLVAALVGVAGVSLAALGRRAWRPAGAGAAVVVAVVVAGLVAPSGRDVGAVDVAGVQGGGPRGLRAVDNPSARGLEAALEATEQLLPGVDLVVWPENAVTVEGALAGTPQEEAVGAAARRLGTTLVAGVVEREGGRFRNLAVAWGPDGRPIDRYEKNQRVPFGEYVPWRSLVERFVDLRAVPRDARIGEGPGLLATPAGDLGVVISYEVFFPRRARAAVSAGGEILLVPTNASSYPTTQMPALELAAARLRALETGRAVVQAAPTGFSAIVGPDGTVRRQSDLGAPAVLTGPVERRTGTTPYTRAGDVPFVVVAGAALAGAWALSRRRPRAAG